MFHIKAFGEFVVLTTISLIINGLVFCLLWNWILFPRGYMQMYIPFAIGILLIREFVFIDATKIIKSSLTKDDYVLYYAFHWIVFPIIFLAFGYMTHLFM